MKIYSAKLPITDKLTKDILIRLVIEWNQGSPYNRIHNLVWDGKTRNIKFEEGNLSLAIEEIRDHNILAIRFYLIDSKKVIWTTDMVADFNKRIFCIKLDRETTVETKEFVPKFKSPVIVNMLLERGYIDKDHDLDISDEPLAIDLENYKVIEDVIYKRIMHDLPVVYVTKAWGKYPCNIQELAYRLKGAAHVLVEEEPLVSKKLQETCKGKNARHGTIGIYYPGSRVAYKIIPTQQYEGRERRLIDRVVTIVCSYINQQARDTLLTWEGVQNELLRLKYASAAAKKVQAENEVDEVYDSFGAELEEKERTIEELNNKIMALQAENQGLHAKMDSMGEVPLLFYGAEEEFYEGEIRDQILDMLAGCQKHVSKNSRKDHILMDILANNERTDRLEQMHECIKRILKGYTKVTDSLKRELREFGFVITKDSGHYKLTYKGDPRYFFIMSASGSDSKHGGGNLSSQIINKVL